jgi:SAM-dependent methyltransferase
MAPAIAAAGSFDPREWESVADFVHGLEAGSGPLETRIHPADEMYGFEIQAPYRTRQAAAVLYFSTARSIFRTVSDVVAWRFGDFGAVGSFLDFACGYGRATRFFARALDPAKITAAEIDPGAVRFQEETFGVRGCLSGTDPGALDLSGRFDVVLAVSFFSHLPADRFEAWLTRLYSHLAEGGVLMFSTHGPDLLPASQTMPGPGLAFRPESETARLEGSEYGTSWVTADYVQGAAARASGGAGRLCGFPNGLCGYQDLYVLAKPPLPSGPDLRLARDPLGTMMHSAIQNGVVTARGWAAGDRDERPPDVKLYLGERLESMSPGHGPPGARRDWSFAFPVSAVSPDAVVRIEAESAKGFSRVLVAETLRPYLPRGA